tara:strand:+ start:454 stop:954 length:501 start_codon:yes stop_codon:yes gene_type:complete
MNYNLNSNDRLQLDKMIKESDAEDKTELIRRTKHSKIIKQQVALLQNLKKKHKNMYENNFTKFDEIAVSECQFLFNNYTEIYNKVIKNEINLEILDKFLNVLKLIENGEIDQHEGSVKVGTYLKELYIDSALKKTEKNDKNSNENEDSKEIEEINISWSQFKKRII